MASILKVDDLRGNTAAGNITITSEGGAATMQLQQGLAKSWLNLTGSGTPAINGTLNVSSITDHGTGEYTENFTNNYSSTNDQSFSGCSAASANYMLVYHANYTASTSSHKFFTANQAVSLVDATPAWIQGHGDLA